MTREFQVLYRHGLNGAASAPTGDVIKLDGVLGASEEHVAEQFRARGLFVDAVTLAREVPALCARDDEEAARVLGVCRTTIWRLTNLPERDPCRIRRTSYGKIPFAELERHVAAELERAA